MTASCKEKEIPIQMTRYNNISKLRLTTARILGIAAAKSFKGGATSELTPQLMEKAEILLIGIVQSKMFKDSAYKQNFKTLNPKIDEKGLLVVGTRMSQHNPMTLDGKRQALVPTKHHLTLLFMRETHEKGHLGRDATVAKFRQNYWTPHADKLAKSVKNACTTCKLNEPKLIQQCMGQLPEARRSIGPHSTTACWTYLAPL